jgi:hypothetical protein
MIDGSIKVEWVGIFERKIDMLKNSLIIHKNDIIGINTEVSAYLLRYGSRSWA